MTDRKLHFVGQLQRPQKRPENVELIVDERPNLTSAERAAGIKWVNQLYEPGNVLRYGTNTTPGTTDMAAAIQAAIDVVEVNGGEVFLPTGTYAIESQLTLTSANHAYLVGEGVDTEIIWTGATMNTSTQDDSTGAMILFSGSDHAYVGIRNLQIDANSKANFCVYMAGTVNQYVHLRDLHCVYAQLDLIRFDGCTFVNFQLDGLTAFPYLVSGFSATDAVCGRYVINIESSGSGGRMSIANTSVDQGVSGILNLNCPSTYGLDLHLESVYAETVLSGTDLLDVTYGGTGTIGAITMVGCKIAEAGSGAVNAWVHNLSANTARPVIYLVPFQTNTAITNIYEEDNDATNDVVYHTKYNKRPLIINAAGVQIMPVDTTFPTSPIVGSYQWNDTNKAIVVSDGTDEYQIHGALVGSTTWDPASIAVGAMEAKDVTVTGAALGDFTIASIGVDVQDLTVSASVTAADTVTVVLANNTAGAVNLASFTVRCRVFQKEQ